MLTKHYGEEWHMISNLIFYKEIVTGVRAIDDNGEEEINELCDEIHEDIPELFVWFFFHLM